MENKEFLKVENLQVQYVTREETVYAVNDISFTLNQGETLGLVGETGAGKTTIARTILRILPEPPAEVKGGSIIFKGKNILKISEEEMYHIRGREISMIFQDPMTSLNPVISVGKQIEEVIRLHSRISKGEARKKAVEMMEKVGIPGSRYGEYPNQFSGGMKQRIVIAIALACDPELLLADEPTTALDVTIQAQVLKLMGSINEKKNKAMILITHDLGVVAQMCDKVAIVYAGQILEIGSKEQIFDHPAHPYTVGLFGAIPKLNDRAEYLTAIAGSPIDSTVRPEGCCFASRCPHARKECLEKIPENREVEAGHLCKCVLIDR